MELGVLALIISPSLATVRTSCIPPPGFEFAQTRVAVQGWAGPSKPTDDVASHRKCQKSDLAAAPTLIRVPL
jgi:hypothetical protein